MTERKLYHMQFSEDLRNVFAISLVSKPAIKENFIYLSADEIILQVDDEKRTVTGAILIPEFKILRKAKNGNPAHDIAFTAETIEKVSQHYMKQLNQKQVTLNHDQENQVEGVTLTEQWLVADSDLDKSVALGLDKLPVGSWVGTMLIEDDAVWEDVKLGKFKGFSIEGALARVEHNESIINFKEDIMSKKNKFIQELKVLLGMETEAVVEAGAEQELTVVTEAAEEVVEEETAPEYVSVEMFNELQGEVTVMRDALGTLMEMIEPLLPQEEEAPVEEPVAASTEEAEEVTEEEVVEAAEEVVEEVVEEEVVEMIAHTDSDSASRNKKLEYNYKLSAQDNIKKNLGI